MTLSVKNVMKLTGLILFVVLILHVSKTRAQTGKYKEHILSASKDVESKVIDWRRDFHQHPELSNREFRTSRRVADHLRSLGIDVTTGIAVTGVKGILKGGQPGPVVALRADMDALPIAERVDIPFASKVTTEYDGAETGVMHACGHDAHTAILMGVAEILSGMKEELKGTVVFIFQPAEEGAPAGEEGGARLMIKEGVLENPNVDVIFGLHMKSDLEAGKISFRPGAFMAAVSDFKIEIKGKGSHGSTPWTSADPIVISAQIINNLQTIVSRNINITQNPAVVTIGSIHGGNRSNIIPESVEMLGTIRVFSPEDEQMIYKKIKLISENIASASDATATVTIPYTDHIPVNFNNVELTTSMLPTLENIIGKDKIVMMKPITGAEDFALYSQKVPGLFFFLGAMPHGQKPEDAPPHHTSDFFLNESSFITGVYTMSNLVFDYIEINTAN